MRHGSLFSGIGGFDLPAEWMGWENIFHCEWNEFGKQILKYYWPKAISYDDITKTDFNIHRGRIDILTGGFPCQPYSQAGKRLGKEDDRHLWPEMLRAIREIQPRWIVGENVFGLVNWNEGMVFEEVCIDLENEGYEVQPFILPACAKDAPHRRDRIWFVAYSDGSNQKNNKGKNKGKTGEIRGNEKSDVFRKLSSDGITSNSDGKRRQRRPKGHQPQERPQYVNKQSKGLHKLPRQNWENFPTQSPICDGDDGFPPKLDGITFPKWRNESIKAGGNAVVPHVVYEIFKSIEKYQVKFAQQVK